MYHQFVGSKAPWYEILDGLPSVTHGPLGVVPERPHNPPSCRRPLSGG